MFVYGHRERQRGTIVANDVDGILGGVASCHDAMEIDEGSPQALRRPEASIVGMVGFWPVLGSPIPITEQSILAERIVVRSLLTLASGDGRDAEGQAAKSWLEDALRTQQWNALAFEGEARSEDLTSHQAGTKPTLLVEKCEGGKPHAQVGIVHADEILPGPQAQPVSDVLEARGVQ
jgi:hypothetical protein